MPDRLPDMTDEPELTAEEWEARKADLTPVNPRVDEYLAPICGFDRAANLSARRNFAEQIAKFLRSPIGPPLPPDAHRIALLPDDLLGAWMNEIEAHDQTVIVTEYNNIPIVVLLTRSDRDVNQVIDDNDISWCNITPSHDAEAVADSAVFPCLFFYWSGDGELIGWDVEVIWPLGHAPGDGDDLNRVSLHGASMTDVVRSLISSG